MIATKKTDPRALIRIYEEASLQRLKGSAASLAKQPSTEGAREGARSWIGDHPYVSLSAAFGAGILAVPSKKRRVKPASEFTTAPEAAARVASAGKLMVYVRLAQTLTSWVNAFAARSSADSDEGLPVSEPAPEVN